MRQALVIWTYYFYYVNVVAFILDAQYYALWYNKFIKFESGGSLYDT